MIKKKKENIEIRTLLAV